MSNKLETWCRLLGARAVLRNRLTSRYRKIWLTRYCLCGFIVAAGSCGGALSTETFETDLPSNSQGTEFIFGTRLGASLAGTLRSLGDPDAAYVFRMDTDRHHGEETYQEHDTLQLQYKSYRGHVTGGCSDCPLMWLDIFFSLRGKSTSETPHTTQTPGVANHIMASPDEASKFLPKHVVALLGEDYIEARQPVGDPDCVDVCDLKQCFGEKGSLLWLYEAKNVRVDWSEYKGTITHTTGISLDSANVRLPSCEEVN